MLGPTCEVVMRVIKRMVKGRASNIDYSLSKIDQQALSSDTMSEKVPYSLTGNKDKFIVHREGIKKKR